MHAIRQRLYRINLHRLLICQQQRHISITFLTDVEGDGSYFDRYVNNSRILAFRSRKPCFDRQSLLQTKWNLGQWDEMYFPYDKEVEFLEDDGVVVYGVSFSLMHV